MILGMAIVKYGYEGTKERNTATGGKKGSIQFDLDQLGLKLSEDTIRKFIKEADKNFQDRIPKPEKT